MEKLLNKCLDDFINTPAENRDSLYIKYDKLFSRIGEFNYWCAHYLEPNFLDSVKCPCGNKARYLSFEKGYSKYCSIKCSSKYSQEQRKKTCLERYGATCASKNPEVKAKALKTRKSLDQKEIQRKTQETMLRKYGTPYYFKSKDFKKKLGSTLSEKNIQHTSQNNIKHIENLNEDYVKKHFICDNKFEMYEFMDYFNLSAHAMRSYKQKFGIKELNAVQVCKTQNEIKSFLDDTGLLINLNDRSIIAPKELDIYIPSKQVAIEYDGLMYHSFGKSKNPIFNNVDFEKENRKYHLMKSISCELKGIKLFHIFENEWQDKNLQSIWKSVILNALGFTERIYARNTKIGLVNKQIKDLFLQENHLQGICASSINLGLYHDGELISLMTFGKSRFNKNYEYELLRFCNKKNISVVGGASKLLKHFLQEYNPKSIISYANRRWSQGKLYKNLGFSLISEVDPNYFYFQEKKKILRSRIEFQKHKLSKILEVFDPNLTESENMYNNGYRKIYDCGNLVYALTI